MENEKLIEQRLKNGEESICEKCFHGKVCRAIDNQPCIECNQFTDANGVTVQEEAKLYWKPVKPGEWNLTCSACDSHLGCREDTNFCPECGAKFVRHKALMPQPPKGE